MIKNSLSLLVCFFLYSALAGAQSDEILRKKIRFNGISWEFSAGTNTSHIKLKTHPGINDGVSLNPGVAAGFQFAAMPSYELSGSFSLRSGLSFGLRHHRYDQYLPISAEYSEKLSMIGIPAQLNYSFGYPDIKFNIIGGLLLNFIARTNLEYSMMTVPGFQQAGDIPISFDRKRFMPELTLGSGARIKAGEYLLGFELMYYSGLTRYSRFDPSRTIYIYQDLEQVIEFYSPGYLTHGVLLNLIIHKWKD